MFGASFLDLSPDEFDVAGGLEKLLAVLRASPLQTLPIPDSLASSSAGMFRRERMVNPSPPELIVREADLLLRSRATALRALHRPRRRQQRQLLRAQPRTKRPRRPLRKRANQQRLLPSLFGWFLLPSLRPLGSLRTSFGDIAMFEL